MPSIVRIYLKPLIASAACGASALLFAKLFDILLPYKIATLAAIVAAGVTYIAVLLLIRGLDRHDVSLLPFGTKILAVLDRFHLIPAEK